MSPAEPAAQVLAQREVDGRRVARGDEGQAVRRRLDAFALASKRAITVPLLRQMLDEEGR